MGANQNAQKLLSTDLVNYNNIIHSAGLVTLDQATISLIKGQTTFHTPTII